MALTGTTGRWSHVNRAVVALLGRSREELLALSYQGVTHPDDLGTDLDRMDGLVGGEIESFEMDKRLVRADGSSVWVHLWVVRVLEDDGSVAGFLSQMHDVTRKRELQQGIAVADARFRRMFESSPIGVVTTTAGRRIVRANDAFCAIVGRAREELIGVGIEEITHEDDHVTDVDRHAALASGDRSVVREKRYVRPDGSVVWASVSTAHLEAGEEAFFGQVVDITERKLQVAELEEQAGTDSLTGLVNRRRFEAELARHAQVSSRYGARGALIMIDLDGFKRVNDTIGHSEGDAALVATAAVLREATRGTDTAARLGGDEFVVLLPEGGLEGATQLARRLVERILVPTGIGVVRASVGVAAFDDDADLTGLGTLARADEALYEAKHRGGACFAVAGAQQVA